MKKLPYNNKVLVISSWGSTLRRGGPLMLDNLLQFFPKGSYVGLAKRDKKNETIFNGAGKPVDYYYYYSLIDRFFSYIETKCFNSVLLSDIKLLVRRFFPPLWEIAFITKKACEIIKKEKVTILLGTSTGNPLISTFLTHLITRRPYYIMLFDLYDGNLIESLADRALAKLSEGIILRNASGVIVTNEGTKNYYQKKHGITPTVIYNSIVTPENLKITKKVARPIRSPITIIFAGVIYWAQLESLKSVIDAVNSLRGISIKMLIYAPQPEESLKKMGIVPSSKVRISEAPPSKMQTIISRADIAFVPLSFHTEAPDIINTATPGKFSEYLLAGIPILVHAPASSYLSQYCRENNLATVVDEQNKEKLQQAIKEIAFNRKLRQTLVTNAQKFFWENYVAKNNAKKFQKFLFA